VTLGYHVLRCRGLVDETLRTEGAHLKTLEMSPTRLNPDGWFTGEITQWLQLLTPDRRRFTSLYGKKSKWMEKHTLGYCKTVS